MTNTFRYIVRQPDKTLLYLSVILITSTLFGVDSTLDIQLHDTYLVLGTLHVGLFLTLVSTLLCLIYQWSKNLALNGTLIFIHAFLTIIAFLIIQFIALFNGSTINPLPEAIPDISNIKSSEDLAAMHDALKSAMKMNSIVINVISVGALSQIILMINLVIAINKKLRL